MPDQTTSPDQDIEKILGRSLASKSAKPIGPQQTPEDDIAKIIGRKPTARLSADVTAPGKGVNKDSFRTEKPAMTAPPKKGDDSWKFASPEVVKSANAPKPVQSKDSGFFGEEGIGKGVGVASAIDKPIEDKIHKVEDFTAKKIDQAADFLMAPQRHDRDYLAANGYPTLAKLSAYSEAVNPININREVYKTAAGMITDPKNWPFLMEGGPAVRPAIKTAGTALFTVMQQYGAIDALKNHDYASAAMQEAFALLGMKDLPAGVREVIGKEAANQHSGKSDTADKGMTAPPEPKKAETKFKNGSTQADIPEHSEAHQALEAARGAIADADLAGKGKDIGGNHVTVRYGIKSDDVDGVRNFLRKQAPFEATLGKTEKFDPTEQSEGAAVVKAPIDSPEMHRINRELDKHGDFIDPTFDYKPHATVAYVKPEAADKYVGMDSTHGKKFMVDSITISGRDGSQEVVKLQGQAKDAVQAPTETPEGKPIPSGAQMMSPKKIEADPRRFQFRTEMSESGLGDVEHYNPDLGGVISVWKDPEDGKTYVVNGHHRLDLAKRAGADNVLVRYLDAPSAKEARAIGALQNIAEDKASPIDAAKFMRDAGKTPEDLKAMGFPLTGKAAKDGLALSKLSDPIFERVTMGEIPVGRAAVIGEELPDYADQTAVLQMIDSQGKKGVRLTDAEIREMARDAKADQKVSEKQVDLFGESTIEKSSSVEKAKLSVWLQKQLSRDKKLFGYVAKTERARELAKAGNIIDVDQSKAVAESSKITEEVYQRLVRAKGPIADALREGAGRWAAGDDEKTVKSETYQKVQAAVEQELKGGTYTPSPTDPIPGMGESRLREVLRSHPGMAGLADDLVDQAAILSQNAIGMPLDEFLRKNWSDVKVEGTPGKGALRQDESLWAWVKQSGSNLSIEPYGEQLSMFGDPEKTFMLRNKKGQEAMVLESQLNRLAEDFPALGKKIGFMQQTGKAVEFAPKGDVPAELPMEQGGLFGDIRRGVEDQEGSLFGPMEEEDPKLLFQDDNPVWYAKSQHILDDPKMPGSQTGHQWLSMLENKGVKADELKWMGIDDFLRDKKKVTKQELQDYIRENQVEVKEVVRIEKGPSGDIREWLDTNQRHREQMIESLDADGYGLDRKPDGSYDVADADGNWLDPKDVPIMVRYDVNQVMALDREIESLHRQNESAQGGTKFNRTDLILGGERKNYSELLLTLPGKEPSALDAEIRKLSRWPEDSGSARNDADQERLNQLNREWEKRNGAQFTSSHFDEPNILAHVRFDERTDADGNRVLFLEEVQSDWHQKGKKVGYLGKETPEEYSKRIYGETWDRIGVNERRQIIEHSAKVRRGVPDAPFKADWHEMAMKRMLRWAAEHGYDKLSWVTGEQTAERYDLSKQVSKVEWVPEKNRLLAWGTDGRLMTEKVIEPSKLPDYIGKDAAEKLLSAPIKSNEGAATIVEWQELSGVDLKVGGEWAKNLYDRAIPNFMSKYGKKWGAKVGHMEFETGTVNDRIYTGPTFTADEMFEFAKTKKGYAIEGSAHSVALEMQDGRTFLQAMDTFGSEALAEELGGKLKYGRPKVERVHSMDITDSMRKSVMEGQPLFQGKKGATEFLNDGKAMVYLFKNADPSTFLHEFIHTMEPYLKPEDRAVIDKWLDKEGIDKPVARKEALARAFEEFHTNGEAPTEAVKPIFQRIQEVMRKIYEAIKDSPLIKPSKEVENLFNRWYGGDPEKLTAEGEIEQLLGRPLETVDIQPTSMFFGEEGQKPLLDIDDKSDAAKQFTAPPESHGFELPPELETPGPGAKNVNTVRETPADILQLRDSLAAVTSPHQGMRERLGNADKLASKISRGKDSLSSSWDHVKTTFAALWNAYRHPLPWTDFDDMFEKWGGANQIAEAEAQSFAREIKRKVPDPLRRQAMVNWIEAGGDKTTLLSQYVRSTAPEYKEAYSLATELNDTEETWARNVSNYMESRLQAAIDGGMLDHGVDNYINRILKKPEDSVAVQKLMGELSMGKLESNPRFTKKRIFETSFAAEQAGFKHVNKDAGFLVTAYDISFNRALAARSFVKSILSGHAPDGRPIVAVSGSGQVIDSESVGEKAYVIRPTTKDGDAAGYGTINHPALNKWIWIAQDGEGNPIYLKGNLVVHPDYIKKLTNTFSKSAFRVNPVGNFALKAYRFGKSSMFSLSPFHQVRVGSGVMLEYWLNPFNAPEIDFQQSKQRKLVEHSLQIVNNSALAEFSDGVSGSGILQAVPYLGKWSQQYAHYVFGDYLPRLKMKLALHLLDKNMEHYKGDLSDDQIYKLTADQANSTVGEQNYHSLARNPTFQDGMRLFLLAPDFLESEAKSFGGALKPYGREKFYALIRSGAVLYMGARLMNMAANNGDPKWDKPFSIVINGHEYSARSEVGDVYHAATDLKSFVLWRLNPYTVKPFVEGVTGRDLYGHKQTFKDQVKKDVSQMLPIPSQEPFDAGINYLKQVAPNLPLSFFNTKPEASIWNGFLESLGIRQSTYRSPAADMAHKMELDSLPASVTKEKLEHSYKVKQLQKEYTEGTLSPMDLGKMVEDDKITDADEKRIMGKQSGYDELQRNLTHRSAEEAMKIWAIATPKERAEVRNELLTKIERSRTITPKQRDKFKEELMEGAFTAPPPEGFHWPFPNEGDDK